MRLEWNDVAFTESVVVVQVMVNVFDLRKISVEVRSSAGGFDADFGSCDEDFWPHSRDQPNASPKTFRYSPGSNWLFNGG
ncbi:unnamed protein product [Nippostrongylus brasiliensis]|uniref:Uncharacterized protein n=1 Tax=Nippostrongylus brasiliensis TaxID=27835 RepID=A0A0N4XJY2_NIPBR|nr:unnamed protein product [Nippostrongylus brasiliensis]